MKWQPIETAPKDGTPILAAWKDAGKKFSPIDIDHYAVTMYDKGAWWDSRTRLFEPDMWCEIVPPEDVMTVKEAGYIILKHSIDNNFSESSEFVKAMVLIFEALENNDGT